MTVQIGFVCRVNRATMQLLFTIDVFLLQND